MWKYVRTIIMLQSWVSSPPKYLPTSFTTILSNPFEDYHNIKAYPTSTLCQTLPCHFLFFYFRISRSAYSMYVTACMFLSSSLCRWGNANTVRFVTLRTHKCRGNREFQSRPTQSFHPKYMWSRSDAPENPSNSVLLRAYHLPTKTLWSMNCSIMSRDPWRADPLMKDQLHFPFYLNQSKPSFWNELSSYQNPHRGTR